MPNHIQDLAQGSARIENWNNKKLEEEPQSDPEISWVADRISFTEVYISNV
jgi:hypothetical protein